MSQDYYEILGVPKTATQEEIKKAYRKLAHQHHPDKGGGDEAKFKEVNSAYQVLSDPEKRAQYDQFGSNFDGAQGGAGGFGGFPGGGFGGFQGAGVNFDDISDIFGDFFGGSRSRRRSTRGRDIEVMVELSLEDVIHDVEKKLDLYREVKCKRCHGNGAEPGTPIETCTKCGGSGQIVMNRQTILGNIQQAVVCDACQGEGKTAKTPCTECEGVGRTKQSDKIEVTIPAGIHDGETLRVSGRGEAGLRGAEAGDLFVKVRVKPKKGFERDDTDVYSQLAVNFSEAALGATKKVTTLHGEVEVDVPAGTQNGELLRLRGKGLPELQGSAQGDHLLEVVVVTPKHLTKKQRELLQQFAVEEKAAEVPHEGFFERIRKKL